MRAGRCVVDQYRPAVAQVSRAGHELEMAVLVALMLVGCTPTDVPPGPALARPSHPLSDSRQPAKNKIIKAGN